MNNGRAVSAGQCVCAIVAAVVGLVVLADASPTQGGTTGDTHRSFGGGNLTAPTIHSPLTNSTLTTSAPGGSPVFNYLVVYIFLAGIVVMFVLLRCCMAKFCTPKKDNHAPGAEVEMLLQNVPPGGIVCGVSDSDHRQRFGTSPPRGSWECWNKDGGRGCSTDFV